MFPLKHIYSCKVVLYKLNSYETWLKMSCFVRPTLQKLRIFNDKQHREEADLPD